MTKRVFMLLLVCVLVCAASTACAAGKLSVYYGPQGVDSVFIGQYDVLDDYLNTKVPLEWYVIDYNDDWFMLLCRNVVAEKRVNPTPEPRWQKTELKKWLDGDFYQNTFSAAEKKHIVRMNSGYVHLLPSTHMGLGFDGSKVIKDHPEIMRLQKTTSFRQTKWWTASHPQVWLGLGQNLTNIRPAYEKMLKYGTPSTGMGYHEGAVYYAVDEDARAKEGYSIFEYGYPLNEPLAVRPVIYVDRNYAHELLGIAPVNSSGPKTIIVDSLFDAVLSPKANIFKTLSPVFGDLSGLKNSYYASKTQDSSIKDEIVFHIDEPFMWGNLEVRHLSFRVRRYKEPSIGIRHSLYITIKDDSPKNDYTGSEMYGNTEEYYENSPNWEKVYAACLYSYKDGQGGMDYSKDANNVGFTLQYTLPDYNWKAFYQP